MGDTVRAQVAYDTELVSDSITRPANATAYAIGAVIAEGTTNDYFTLTLDRGNHLNTGTVDVVRVVSSAAQTLAPSLDLYLFSQPPATQVDGSPVNYSAAELNTVAGIIELNVNDWRQTALASICEIRDLALAFKSEKVNGQTTLYGQLVTRNAYVPVASEEFTLELVVAHD